MRQLSTETNMISLNSLEISDLPSAPENVVTLNAIHVGPPPPYELPQRRAVRIMRSPFRLHHPCQEIDFEDPLVYGIRACLTSVQSYPFDRKCSKRSRKRGTMIYRFVVFRTTYRTICVIDRWERYQKKWHIPISLAADITFDVRVWYGVRRHNMYSAPANPLESRDIFDPSLFEHYTDAGCEDYYPAHWFDDAPCPYGVEHAKLFLATLLYVKLLEIRCRTPRVIRVHTGKPRKMSSVTLNVIQPAPGTYSSLQRNSAYVKDYNRLVPQPIVVIAKVEGQDARALLDSGSLADFMSSRFADQIKIKRTPLAKPLPVGMATSGSRSMSNYCAEARLQFAEVDSVRHFDILNLENYGIILGMLFLYQHKVVIGFNNSCVFIGSAELHPL